MHTPKTVTTKFNRGLITVILILLLIISILPLAIDTAPEVHAQRVLFVGAAGYDVSTTYSLNPFGSYNPVMSSSMFPFVYDRLAYYVRAYNAFFPQLAEKWEPNFEKNTFVVYLRKDVVWHDGTPFTCKDVWTYMKLRQAQNPSLWRNYLTDVVCLDDYTVEYRLRAWSQDLPYQILWSEGLITTPHKWFGKWADEVENVVKNIMPRNSTLANQMLLNIIRNYSAWQPPAIVGTGPYAADVFTNQEVHLVKFNKYYNVKNVLIDKVIGVNLPSDDIMWFNVRSGILDYAVGRMTEEVMEEVRATRMGKFANGAPLQGHAIAFNYLNKWLARREVRWAIALAINLTRCKLIQGPYTIGEIWYPTGFAPAQNDYWGITELIQKGVIKRAGNNPKEAEELLKKVGFYRGSDRKWRTPEGQVFKLVARTQAGFAVEWTLYQACEDLKEFGIECEFYPTPGATWSTMLRRGDGWDLAGVFWGTASIYGLSYVRNALMDHRNRGGRYDIFMPKDTVGMVYVPYFDVTVNITHIAMNLTYYEMNWDKLSTYVKMLAVVFNYYLPEQPLIENAQWVFISSRWDWPDPDNELWYKLIYLNAPIDSRGIVAQAIRMGLLANPKKPDPATFIQQLVPMYPGWSLGMLPKEAMQTMTPTPTTTTATTSATTTPRTSQPVTSSSQPSLPLQTTTSPGQTLTSPLTSSELPTTSIVIPPGAVVHTVTVTSTAIRTALSVTSVSTAVRETDWTLTAVLPIVLFVVGFTLGMVLRKK